MSDAVTLDNFNALARSAQARGDDEFSLGGVIVHTDVAIASPYDVYMSLDRLLARKGKTATLAELCRDPVRNYKFSIVIDRGNHNVFDLGCMTVKGLRECGGDYNYLSLCRGVVDDVNDECILDWFRNAPGESASIVIKVAKGPQFTLTSVMPNEIEYGELDAGANNLLTRTFEFTYDKLVVKP